MNDSASVVLGIRQGNLKGFFFNSDSKTLNADKNEVFLFSQNMGYKWEKPRKLVSLIPIAGERWPQSHIAKSVPQTAKLSKSILAYCSL